MLVLLHQSCCNSSAHSAAPHHLSFIRVSSRLINLYQRTTLATLSLPQIYSASRSHQTITYRHHPLAVLLVFCSPSTASQPDRQTYLPLLHPFTIASSALNKANVTFHTTVTRLRHRGRDDSLKGANRLLRRSLHALAFAPACRRCPCTLLQLQCCSS